MGLPATNSGQLVLVFLNGIKQSAGRAFEVRGRYIRFTFKIKAQDLLSLVSVGPDPWELEVQVPYCYGPDDWFDPTDFHDPAVKKLDAPEPTVTQL